MGRWQVAGARAPGGRGGRGELVEKSGEGSLTSSNSLCFKSYTFTKVMELQHWKIFTPGKVKICKTNVKFREISQLFRGGRNILQNLIETIFFFIRGKSQQGPYSHFHPCFACFLLFPPFPHSPLLAFHPLKHILKLSLTGCGTPGLTCLFKRPPYHGASLSPPLSSVSVVQQTTGKGFCRKSFRQRSGTGLDSYLPIVLDASVNVGVRDLTQEENLGSERKCICL